MTTLKLKGSRLEAEVDKCRGECSWVKLNELLPTIKSKGGSLEENAKLFEGEVQLETLLEANDSCYPDTYHYDSLKSTEKLLRHVVDNSKEPAASMEAHLLLAKLHFYCANYLEAIRDIEQSRLDVAKTQFATLRSLKLAAEGYAIKGFATEKTASKHQQKTGVVQQQDVSRQRILGCFETATELTISYISELQKSISSKRGNRE